MTSIKEFLFKPLTNERKVRILELESKLFDDSLIYKNDDELMDFQYNIIKTINKTQYRINNGLTKIPKTLMRKLDKLEEQIEYINYEIKFRLHLHFYFSDYSVGKWKWLIYDYMYDRKHIKCLDCKRTFEIRDYHKHKYKVECCSIFVYNLNKKKHNYCLCGSMISQPHLNYDSYLKHLKSQKHHRGLNIMINTNTIYYNNNIKFFIDDEETEGYIDTFYYVMF